MPIYAIFKPKTQKIPATVSSFFMLFREKFYSTQLFFNFLWPLVFFGGQMYLTAFIVLIALWIGIFFTMRWFSQIDETAGDLLIPYLLWVTFAGYLNLGVFLLN